MVTLKGKAIRERDHALRDSLFQNAGTRLWDRNRFHGFATVPKTMPYICRILDELSKGHPLASTYLALWCATWDDAFIKLGRTPGLAFAAGFTGQRGMRTFNDRTRKLVELGFVEVAPSGSQSYGLAYLPNPHIRIMRLYAAKNDPAADPDLKTLSVGMQAATYNAFIERAQEVDCTDVKEELRDQQRVTTDEDKQRSDGGDADPSPQRAARKRATRPRARPKAPK